MVASAVAATVAISPPDDRAVAAVGEALGSGGEYHKLTPERIFDSRTRDLDVEPYGPKSTSPLGSSVAFDVPVVGMAGLPLPDDADGNGYDDNVLAVVVNIIVIDPTQPGYLRAYPAGAAEGETSVVNFPARTTVPNTAVIRPGIAGEISIRLVSPPAVGTADVAIDISGWFSTQQHTNRGARLIPISPIRAYDSALPQFGGDTLGARSLTEVPIRPVFPDEPNIVGAVVNVTGVNTFGGSRPTYISALPDVVPRGEEPSTSTVNLQVGQVKANLAIVPVGNDGSIHLFNMNGEIRLVVDIMGYLVTGMPEDTQLGRVVPLVAPFRAFDTRLQEHKATPLGPARSEPWSFGTFVDDVTIDGQWVGDQVGLLGNLTATNLEPQYPGAPVVSFMTAYPSPESGTATPPFISNLNIFEGETVPNMALLKYGGDTEDPHRLQFYNRAGYVDYLLDVYAVVLADQPVPG